MAGERLQDSGSHICELSAADGMTNVKGGRMPNTTTQPVRRAALSFRDVSFSYPETLSGGVSEPVLRDVSFEIGEGSFALLTGSTGSGKTTLMRLAKHEIAPAGSLTGAVEVFGRDVRTLDARASGEGVGFVFQSPDNQIVCDTVWHELAFGLENLGIDEAEMRLRIAETCQFLGMEHLFRKQCHELSGGQRQLVALAAVLVMRPKLLLLDEPTSQLDPIAEKDFLALLFRVNRELGVTVLVATHRPHPMGAYATCSFELADGCVHEAEAPWAHDAAQQRVVGEKAMFGSQGVRLRSEASSDPALVLDDLWFRYGRNEDWVLRGMDLKVGRGEVRAVLGGNGSGKSTLLFLAAGALRARRGNVRRPLASSQALLPQSPRALFACETVREELEEWQRSAGYGTREVDDALGRLGLVDAGGRHPLDLSSGQQQLLALEKLLLTKPQLLLLDEPTKGLDDGLRDAVTVRVRELSEAGVTVVVATHDIDFVRGACDTVSLLFDGQVVLTSNIDDFLTSSWVYGRAL